MDCCPNAEESRAANDAAEAFFEVRSEGEFPCPVEDWDFCTGFFTVLPTVSPTGPAALFVSFERVFSTVSETVARTVSVAFVTIGATGVASTAEDTVRVTGSDC